jgi:hypothetical protein
VSDDCCSERKLSKAALAADELLVMLGRTAVVKVDNPSSRAGFLRVVARIQRALMEATESLDVSFANKMLKALDVEWDELLASERDAALARAESMLPKPASYAKLVYPIFAEEAVPLVAAARAKAVQGVSLPIIDFANDEVVQHLIDGQAFYVAAEMQQRNVRLNEQVRALVLKAFSEGWTRKRLVKALGDVVRPDIILAKQEGYLDVLAGSFVGYARSYGQLSAYTDANISEYIWESVLDEVTCDVCRFLHGTVFEVEAGLNVFNRMAGNLDSGKEAAPWLRVGTNTFGERVIYSNSFGHRSEIATVLRSGVGTKDDEGQYASGYSAAQLAEKGLCLPPCHGRCRCTTVANV